MKKTAYPTPRCTAEAQPLSPKSDALKWLSIAQAARTSFRVPLEITVSRLGVSGGSLGFADDRIEVKLNDSAMGMGLCDRAHHWCANKPTCAMWVWARWQDGTLIVTEAEQAIQPADRATATHIHIATWIVPRWRANPATVDATSWSCQRKYARGDGINRKLQRPGHGDIIGIVGWLPIRLTPAWTIAPTEGNSAGTFPFE